MTDPQHLYLSLIPQALIASMLAPEAFGSYYSIGAKVHVQGESIFFEVDPGFRDADLPFELIEKRCVRTPEGALKRSVYLAIYRVLERIPVAALGNLHLVTNDGKTLTLERAPYQPHPEQRSHLYQEFSPVTPLVASRLEPHDFCDFITDPDNPVHVPRVVFSELRLGALATDPEHGAADDLPYPNLAHLRDVLVELNSDTTTKSSKLVLRQVKAGVLYRMVHNGFYVGDQQDFAYYPFPDHGLLEDQYRDWWRSAQLGPLA
ncbi:hypothetical protein [Marichromatium sp. AB31]|uniref:hypothetical protein n=1 Tax=Marichromatium sp. AB31 TaxID=2483362 RepID=UPI000F3C540D|nr:hypothetical protein [Marichromatium sp. AB31]RNE90646.1 hypothetical protein EBL84_06960 [Marichromatium sp. AB31]